MSFQFPASPVEGQVFAPAGGPQYVYRAPYWRASGRVDTIMSETPPVSPKNGQLWFNSSTGNTYIWYEDPNSAQWVQINVGPSPSDGSVNPERFGAIGDNVADDLAALQAMVDYAGATGSEIVFDGQKTYRISNTLFIPSGVIIHANGATIDGTGLPAATTLGQIYGIRLLGTIGSDVTVTASAAKGTRVLTVADTAGLAPNDIILVKSDEPWPLGTSASNRKGALHKVKSVDSATQITLWDGLFFSYDTAILFKYARLTPVVGVTIYDLTVIMGGVGKGHNGIGMDYCDDCWLINCTVRHSEDCNVRPAYCFGGGVIGGEYTDATSSATIGTTGYGVVVGKGCRNFKVESAVLRNNRHSIAGGGVHPAILAQVVGNTIYGGISDHELDCHEDCIWWTISHNQISGSTDGATGTGGIIVRGQHCIVSENTIIGARSNAIYVKSFDTTPSGQTGCKVLNNHIEDSKGNGINIAGTTTAPAFDIEIRGNTIRRCAGEGIVIRFTYGLTISDNLIEDITGVSMNGIRLVGSATAGDQCTDFVISGNRVTNVMQNGIQMTFAKRGSLSDNVVSGVPTTYPVLFTNCDQIVWAGGYAKSTGATVHGVRIDTCTKIMLRPGILDGGGSATSSAGVSILGTSSDISVIGGIITGYQYPVRATGTVNYIMASQINGRGCNVAIDAAAAANKVVVDNL